MLDYAFRLQEPAEDKGRPMLFFTEESDTAVLDAGLAERMREAGITWVPLRYHLAGPQFLQRLRNAAVILTKGRSFAKGNRPATVIGFLSMAGSYASLLRSLGFKRFILVSFEPHSRYMEELGVWRKGSFKVKLAAWFERRQVRNADYLISPTRAGVAYAEQMGSRAHVAIQGVTVDVQANARREQAGRGMRERLGLGGKVVLAYAGKFNGLYYSEADYVRFMAATCAMDDRVHHLVITFPEHASAIRAAASGMKLDGRFTLLDPVTPQDLPSYLSASDIGVLAVPPTPSQVYRTPVKSALYWAAGLPMIIPEGVSDDWWIVRDRGLGLVVPCLGQVPEEGFKGLVAEVAGPGVGRLRERCIQTAMELRDTAAMVRLLRAALSGEWAEQAAEGAERLPPVQP
ncbi:MAG: hypothetical protein KBF80_07640 [Flavobacteriales bacterium]|nr:hypothetical protein [Flavobacteriales bacterium]